ncbi:MAG: hypothetical protein M1816_006778 [Peltula sp. TS41687]|nr:MAG: hypothetical protein M1816_006778 [Peltula sp. TS41687]
MSEPWSTVSRTRGGYPWKPLRQERDEPQLQPPSPPLGAVLMTLSQKVLTNSLDLKDTSAEITDCEYVASYNWLNKDEPTILVSAVKLKEDNGSYFVDPNAARYAQYPTEPAVRALLIEQPEFPTTSVDVFACGNTMGNLLRFVRKLDRSFRFLMEVVGSTVFFIRRENSATELIPHVRGCGHAFPEAYTTWEKDAEGSESHQRIVKYNFGGLKCLVRAESDGYLKDVVGSGEPGKAGTSHKLAESQDDADPRDLSETFGLTLLGQKPSVSSKALTIKRGGQWIPQKAIFDLKTRSALKKDDVILADMLPRLWVAQIPNFVLTYHLSGVFKDIRIMNVQDDMEVWQTENEDVLRQFAVLVRKIADFARSRSDGKLEIRRVENGDLELREQAGDDHDVLPPHLKAYWIGERGPPQGTDVTTVDDGSSKNEGLPRDELEYPRTYDDLVDEWAVSEFRSAMYDSGEDYHQDDDSDKDYTACSAEDCGYCGHCRY